MTRVSCAAEDGWVGGGGAGAHVVLASGPQQHGSRVGNEECDVENAAFYSLERMRLADNVRCLRFGLWI